ANRAPGFRLPGGGGCRGRDRSQALVRARLVQRLAGATAAGGLARWADRGGLCGRSEPGRGLWGGLPLPVVGPVGDLGVRGVVFGRGHPGGPCLLVALRGAARRGGGSLAVTPMNRAAWNPAAPAVPNPPTEARA